MAYQASVCNVAITQSFFRCCVSSIRKELKKGRPFERPFASSARRPGTRPASPATPRVQLGVLEERLYLEIHAVLPGILAAGIDQVLKKLQAGFVGAHRFFKKGR